MSDEFVVVHNPDAKRFEVVLGDDVAMLEYMIAGKNIVYTHTEVPPVFEGRGIANKLAHFAMEYAKAEGLKVQAVCPFVVMYVRKHPEYHGITWGYSSPS
jgi:predicted GNAT family acetyltransferase